jgi:hypothetical protein
MATYVPPKRATQFIFNIGLRSATTNEILDSPTLAAGDFKISKDNGATANLSTLPSVDPAASGIVKVTVSATEMTADNVTIIAKDAAGAEWVSLVVNIQTTARQMDDLAYPTTSGRSLDVTATGAAGIDWANVENPTTANVLSGTTVGVATTLTNSGNPKKNTALAAFPFLMTATSTHDPVTGATVTVTRSIDGGAFAAGSLSVVTEVANGIYVVDFAAGDLNGNNIILMATATGCDVTLERITTAL